jgi:hypothetical protein
MSMDWQKVTQYLERLELDQLGKYADRWRTKDELVKALANTEATARRAKDFALAERAFNTRLRIQAGRKAT